MGSEMCIRDSRCFPKVHWEAATWHRLGEPRRRLHPVALHSQVSSQEGALANLLTLWRFCDKISLRQCSRDALSWLAPSGYRRSLGISQFSTGSPYLDRTCSVATRSSSVVGTSSCNDHAVPAGFEARLGISVADDGETHPWRHTAVPLLAFRHIGHAVTSNGVRRHTPQ